MAFSKYQLNFLGEAIVDVDAGHSHTTPTASIQGLLHAPRASEEGCGPSPPQRVWFETVRRQAQPLHTLRKEDIEIRQKPLEDIMLRVRPGWDLPLEASIHLPDYRIIGRGCFKSGVPLARLCMQQFDDTPVVVRKANVAVGQRRHLPRAEEAIETNQDDKGRVVAPAPYQVPRQGHHHERVKWWARQGIS